LQASIPLIPPALICTIEAVESSWLTIPIQGIRELEHQSFRVIRAPDLTGQAKGGTKVEPRTVIDSGLTILAEIFNHSDTGNQELSDMDSLITHGHTRPPWGSWRSEIPAKLLRP
jgi:hypothetical protein